MDDAKKQELDSIFAGKSIPEYDTLDMAMSVPEEQAIASIKLARNANIPLADAVKTPNAAVSDNVTANDLNTMKDTHPKTASFLNNPIYLSSARTKADTSSLMSMEGMRKHWDALENGVKSVGYAIAGTGKMIADIGKEGQTLEPISLQDKLFSFDNVKRAVASFSNPLALDAMNQASTVALNSDYLKLKEIKNDTQLGQFITDVEQNIPQLAAQLGVSLLSGGTASMIFMGTQIAGQQYADLKKENVSTEDAAKASLTDAAAQMPLERIGLGSILKVSGSGVKQKLATIAKATLTEGITEFLQQYPQDATDLLAKNADKPLQERLDLLKKDLGTMTQNAAYAGLIGGFLGGGSAAIHVSLQKHILEARKKQLDSSIEKILNSPLMAKSPETLAAFKNQLEGDRKYFIDSEPLQTYAQSNPNEKVLDKLGLNQDDVNTAVEAGHMIPVNAGDYEVFAAQDPKAHEALKNDLAFDDEGLTTNRSELLNSKEIIKQQEEIQKQDEEFQLQKEGIYDNLRRIGLNDQEATSTLALLVSNAYQMNPDSPSSWLKENTPIFSKRDTVPGIIRYDQNAKELKSPFKTTQKEFDSLTQKEDKNILFARLKEQGHDGIIISNPEGKKTFIGFSNEGYNSISIADKELTKGRISWDEEGQAYISLFEKGDMATLVHETVGHYFVQNLMNEAVKPDAPAWMKKDMQTMLDYAGVDKPFNELTRNEKITAHEHWAEAAETYMMEGKAPNKELIPVFQRFKKWILAIYAVYKRNSNAIALNDDVRSVFDRLLANEADVQQVENYEGYLKKLPSDLTGSLTEYQKKMLAMQIEKAHDKAVDNLAKSSLQNFTTERKAEITSYREGLREEATTEVEKNNLYKASDALLEDNNAKEIKPLAEKYKELTASDYNIENELTDEQAMWLDKFDMLAESLGFSSGDELAYKLSNSPTKAQAIKAFIDEKVNQKYPGVSIEKKARYEEAKKSLYNDDSGLVIAEENKIIESKVNEINENKIKAETLKQSSISLRENMKLAAQDFLATKTVNDAINLKSFMTAERKAAEKAAVSISQKDYSSALQYKRLQLYNHSLVQESLKIKQEADRNMKFLKSVGSSKMETWKKEEHFVQAADIMSRFGVIRKDYNPNLKTESLQDWALRMNETYDNISIEPWLYSDRKAFEPQKTLNIGELTDIVNALKNIKKAAQDEAKFSKFMGGRMVDEVVSKLNEQLSSLETVYTPQPGQDEPVSPLKKYAALLENRDTFLERLDDWKHGLFSALFGDSIEDRANAEAKMKLDYNETEKQNLEKYFPNKKDIENASKKIYYDDLKNSVDKWTLIELALNTGSESSKRVVFNTPPVGFEKSPLWVKGDALQTENNVMKFLGKNLSASDWSYVQGAWNNMKFVWPLAQEVQKQATGFYTEGVKALPFEVTLADGTVKFMQGGYHPLGKDRRITVDSGDTENVSDPLYKQNSNIRTLHTYTGYQKNRTGASYEIDLTPNSRYKHMEGVIHDINFRLLVNDTRKLMNNEQFASTLKSKLGRERYSAFKDYLATAANPWTQSANWADEVFGSAAMWLRNKTTTTAIMLNIKTSLQNLGNFLLYAHASEGFTYGDVLRGTGKALFDYNTPQSLKNVRDFISSKSIFMKERNTLPDFTLRDIKESGKKQTAFEKNITNWGTQMLVFTDNLSANPMWITAYEKSIGQGKAETEAIRFADSIVRRTLGSSRYTDVAPIIRSGKVMKLLTMFQTFFNTQYQQWAKETGIFLRDKDIARLTAFVASKWLLFCFANMLTSLRNPFDEKDRKELYSDLATYPATLAGPGGQIGSEAIKKVLGLQSYGYRMSATQSSIDNVLNTGGKVNQVITGKKEPSSLVEPVVSVVGLKYGVPAQFNKLFFNGYDILFNGMQPEVGDIVRRRPKKER